MSDDGTITINTKINTKSFEAQISELEYQLDELVEDYKAIEEMKPFEGQETELKKIAREVEKTKNRIIDLKEKEDLASKIDFSNVGRSLEKVGQKVLRFGLGLLGMHGIYGALSKATHTYLSSNEETAQKLNAIWVALGNLIGPIIEKVAEWVMQLVGYLNVFLKTVSGGKIDLSKSMNKNTKSVKATTGAMKELNKQITQFDEATKLQDNSKLDSGGGVGGLEDTTGVLDDLNNIDLKPEIVEKIEDFAEAIKSIMPKEVKKSIKALEKENDRLNAFRKVTAKSEEMTKRLRDISKKNTITTDEMAFATQSYNSQMTSATQSMIGAGRALHEVNTLGVLFSSFIPELNENIEDNDVAVEHNMYEIINWTKAQDRLRESGKMTDTQFKYYKQTLYENRDALQSYSDTIGNADPRFKLAIKYLDLQIDRLEGNKTAWTLAYDAANKFNNLTIKDKEVKVTISQRIVSSVSDFANFSKNFAEAILLAMKTSIESLNIANSVKSSMRKAFGLASGGIINLPGAGVPIANGVIGGERGAEGVIPLTDSQQMEILGEAIGKYITINASITNTMNGRVISRELQKINGENDFASNR